MSKTLATPIGEFSFQIEKQKRRIRIPVYGLICVISVYGCIAFVKRGFPGYMTGIHLENV